MAKAKLVVMRHGQTGYNKDMLMAGQWDVPLTKIGEEEARAAGPLLDRIRIRFDKVYSSNLSRAFDTATYALESSKTQGHLLNPDGSWQIEKRSEIAEMDTGDFTGRNFMKDPEISGYAWTHAEPLPGGESEKQVVERVNNFFNNEVKPRLDKGENVLLVAHAGILSILEVVFGLEELPEKAILASPRKNLPNASPFVYEFEDEKVTGSPYLIENPVEHKVARQAAPLPVPPSRQKLT
ncbi:MAG: phosphoglycerate mutase family protein [Pseudomonadota bacterium]